MATVLPSNAQLYLVADRAPFAAARCEVHFVELSAVRHRGPTAASSVVTIGRQSPCLRWAVQGSRACSRRLLRFELRRTDAGSPADGVPACPVHPQLAQWAVRLHVRDKNRLVEIVPHASAAPVTPTPGCADQVTWLRVGDRVVVRSGATTLCLMAVCVQAAKAGAVTPHRGSASCTVTMTTCGASLGVPLITCPTSVEAWGQLPPRARHAALCAAWDGFRGQLSFAHPCAAPVPHHASPTSSARCNAVPGANSQLAVLCAPDEEEAATPSHSQRVRGAAHCTQAIATSVVDDDDESGSARSTSPSSLTLAAARHAGGVTHPYVAAGRAAHTYVETYDEKLDDALCDLESRSNVIGFQLLERGSSASVLGASEEDGLPVLSAIAGPSRETRASRRIGPTDAPALEKPSCEGQAASSLPPSCERREGVFVNTSCNLVRGGKRVRADAERGDLASAAKQQCCAPTASMPRPADESQEVFFRH